MLLMLNFNAVVAVLFGSGGAVVVVVNVVAV